MFKWFWYGRFSQKQAAIRDWDLFLQTFLSIAPPTPPAGRIPFYPSSLRCVNFVFLPYPLVTVRCMQMSLCLLQQTPTHLSSSPSQTQCNYCTANLLMPQRRTFVHSVLFVQLSPSAFNAVFHMWNPSSADNVPLPAFVILWLVALEHFDEVKFRYVHR